MIDRLLTFLEIKQAPITVESILANQQVKDVLDNFIKTDLRIAEGIIIVYARRDGGISLASTENDSLTQLGMLTVAQNLILQGEERERKR